MGRKRRIPTKNPQKPSHREYAEIVSRRFGVTLSSAESALKTLDPDPPKAFSKLANMGDEKALEYIIWH